MSTYPATELETPQRILVVDDEGIVLVALREILMREGYQVMTYNNPLQALEALKQETFSVIITDQQMPMLSGLEFLAQARRLQPDATRILITAVLSLDTVIDAINKGEIYRFIVKPWLREELLATLKSAVQRYELTCRNHILQVSALSMNEKIRELNAVLEQRAAQLAKQSQQIEQLNRDLEQQLSKSVSLSVEMLQSFSPMLGLQARRAHEICVAMAEALNLSASERETLQTAALLSNIGLVGVSRDIIRKQLEGAELTDGEREAIERHSVLGQQALQSLPEFKAVAEVIRSHHERFDGGGYPDQLSRSEIPWLARLLAVAVSCAEAQDQGPEGMVAIQALSGSAFDPQAVHVFLAVYPKVMSVRRQRQVSVAELRPGMVLAKGIYTASGTLLLPEGRQLTESNIGHLLDHSRKNPLEHLLLVTC